MSEKGAGAVSDVLVRRRRRIGSGVIRLIIAVLVVAYASVIVDEITQRLGTFHWGTSVYQRAQWASTVALASWLAAACALAAWLFGTSLRKVFGLPPRPRGRWHTEFNVLRILLLMALGFFLIIWAAEEMIVRKDPNAPHKALAMGLGIILLLAYDVPRLVRRGLALLRARLPLLAIKLVRLDELRASGRVMVRGEVSEILREAREGKPREVAYRRWLGEPPAEPGKEPEVFVEASPFILTGEGGGRAQVTASADDMVVQGNPQQEESQVLTEVRLGDRVHVVGDAQLPGGDGPYRQGGVVQLEAKQGPIYIFGAAGPMSRRLVLAGAVELLSAAALAACFVALIVFWLFAGAAMP